MTGKYEVYKALSQEGEVLYVGYGKHGRHAHCMSGISHNKELNRYYFTSNGNMYVEVIHNNLTKSKAKQIEGSLIKSLKPKFNVVGAKQASPVLHKKRFNSVFVNFEELISCGANYREYFKSLSMKSEKEIKDTLQEDSSIAKLMEDSNDIQRLHSLIGDQGFLKSPFFIYVGSMWVYNRAAEYGFGITPEALKSYFA